MAATAAALALIRPKVLKTRQRKQEINYAIYIKMITSILIKTIVLSNDIQLSKKKIAKHILRVSLVFHLVWIFFLFSVSLSLFRLSIRCFAFLAERFEQRKKIHPIKMAHFYSTTKMIIFFNSHKKIQCTR